MDDNDIFSFLNGFKTGSKDQITKEYIEGKITKEEFIRRMKKCQEQS